MKRFDTGRADVTVEAKEENNFKDWCIERGLLALKLQLGTEKGFPDRTIMSPGGRICFIEMKKERGGVLSVHQRRWVNQLTQFGFSVKVCAGAEEAKREIEKWW